jgi:O-antigen/teichoic acid export membrane protein
VVLFGARGQLGDLLWLVNLRLDFLILGVLSGPAVLGLYAVASKCAELMRLPATAVNYVLYPRFARSERSVADAQARHLLWRACGLTVAAAPLMAVVAVVGLPLLYGRAFQGAVLPACLLLIGLAFEGATAVASGYLRGIGRPGTNSVGMAAGVAVTVLLDILLIPRHGAVGAALASSAAYLVTTFVLVVLAYRAPRPLTVRAPAVIAEART